MSSVPKKKLTTVSLRNVKKCKKKTVSPIMWMTDDASILKRPRNVVCKCEREADVHRFKTDNRTDKTLSSVLESPTSEKKISMRVG